MSTLSIIGSGGMAAAIGGLAARAGCTIQVLSRDPANAQALAERISPLATTGAHGSKPASGIVVLAVPYAVVLDVVRDYGGALSGKLLVDITNPINADFTDFVTPPGSSGAQEIAKIVPAGAVVVKAFNFQFSHVLAAGSFQGRVLDVFMAGDDALAKSRVSNLIAALGLRPMDAGPLAMAHALESFAMLSLGLVSHSIRHTNFALGVTLPG